MEQYLELIISSVEQFGVWFVVAFLFIENIPLVGFVAPGLTILVLSGFFYELITGNYITLFLIAWLTTFVADTLWFSIGYFGQRKTRWLRQLADRSPDVEELLGSQPVYMLTTYQFIPYFRMFLPFALGMYRYSPHRWLPICIIGSALYTAVFLGIGVAGVIILGGLEAVESITSNLNRILSVFAVVYGVFLLRKYYSLQEKNSRQ